MINIKNEKVVTRVVNMNLLPDIEYHLESRSENEDYNEIYQKYLKSPSKRIKLNWNQLDLISACYHYDDNEDFQDEIQTILYGRGY